MDSIDIYEFNSQAIHILDQREAQLELPYWFTEDESPSYCELCIKAIKPDAEWIEDYAGGYNCESDGSVICEHCGKGLQYTLTDYGVEQEMSHFEHYALDWDNPNDCHDVARIAHGLLKDDDVMHKRLYDIFQASENKPEELFRKSL